MARTTVSTHEEDSIEFLSFSDKIGKLLGVHPERRLVLKEGRANGVIFEVLNRSGVQGRFASSRRGYGDVGMGRQYVIRVSELRMRFNQLACFATMIDDGEFSLSTTQSFSPCHQCDRGM